MLKINLNEKEYRVDIITARKMKQTIAFKKKYDILQAQGVDEERIIDEIVQYIADVYANRVGEKLEYQFTADELYDFLPLKDLRKIFIDTINTIMGLFSQEEDNTISLEQKKKD